MKGMDGLLEMEGFVSWYRGGCGYIKYEAPQDGTNQEVWVQNSGFPEGTDVGSVAGRVVRFKIVPGRANGETQAQVLRFLEALTSPSEKMQNKLRIAVEKAERKRERQRLPACAPARSAGETATIQILKRDENAPAAFPPLRPSSRGRRSAAEEDKEAAAAAAAGEVRPCSPEAEAKKSEGGAEAWARRPAVSFSAAVLAPRSAAPSAQEDKQLPQQQWPRPQRAHPSPSRLVENLARRVSHLEAAVAALSRAHVPPSSGRLPSLDDCAFMLDSLLAERA